MSLREVRVNGIYINGNWYWDEALYGFHGTVICAEPQGKEVAIFDMDRERICTVALMEVGDK